MADTALPAESAVAFQTPSIRRLIILSYWVAVIIGLPIWLYTTSIQRLSLPESQVISLQGQPVDIPVNLYLDDVDNILANSDHFVRTLQTSLQSCTSSAGLALVVTNAQSSTSDYDYRLVLKAGSADCKIDGRSLRWEVNRANKASLATQMTATLCELLAPRSSAAHERRVVQYAPKVRLAFSLLNEEVFMEDSFSSWNIESLFQGHVAPLLERLSPLHNFSVESQTQFYAPLAFDPQRVDNGHVISRDQLTVFVNSAEWTLASGVTTDPVLHFLLFIPSKEHRPLHIESSMEHDDNFKAFLVPQWGGVVIYNPPALGQPLGPLPDTVLQDVLSIYENQLLALLGVSANSQCITDSSDISQWQLDALMRRRTIENVNRSVDALNSIVKVVNSIQQMPVGKDVREDVNTALDALAKFYPPLPLSPSELLAYSDRALSTSSHAFFNPGMLALLYFPDAHNYAVYLPLFAPILVPLFVTGIKEFKVWRKQRKQQKLDSHKKAE
ncbi:hypothetical protein SISNIDRAFT_447022 [Sistotremastrum niveocremeum HHB9708]|uniref:GPI transamidase component PIG-S n=1 Tax=Sistotremastrum niveocremeum HHB9708 TaxID=1314777 RepID=A0A164N1P7_9AGAM|nr:hypothetical protein SISNIDRAFT_447022 [Sistotremastrum niveocremeum HHB9708]